MKELTDATKYLGASVGFISVLHTWGQNLDFHPHIHMIVTGGGLTSKNSWKKSNDNFFIPVKVLSEKFRGKFLFFLKELFLDNKLSFFNSISDLNNPSNFFSFLNSLYDNDWYSFIKRPFDGPLAVIEYLGRYTHKIAISNYRIGKIENDKIFFKYKDYKDNSKTKIMSLDAVEFIRRFLLHVLPKGFRKIRHYGILANVNKKTKLLLARKLSGVMHKYKKLSKLDLLLKVSRNNAFLCPKCKGNTLMPLGFSFIDSS